MPNERLKIAFVRRGYSATGGAEAYLKRLAGGLIAAGHEASLFTTEEWPPNEWPFGAIERSRASSAIGFADAIRAAKLNERCDVVVSLERIWDCDVYRAGDGVHHAWLKRRAAAEGVMERLFRQLNGKHREMLRLEQSLLGDQRARRIVANSQMVKREITAEYNYPADRIDVVYNGGPIETFNGQREQREATRVRLGLKDSDTALLFAGSGWERKGLRYAADAVRELSRRDLKLLVAGRGNERKFRSPGAQFLGPVTDLPNLYAAADIFILPTLYDPFSNACLEAMASGLPVITTSANGFAEIIQDGVHGTIINVPIKTDSLAEAITYWSDPARRAAARSAILSRAAEFDISRNVTETLAILLQAAASAASTSGKIRKT
jgi:UDP-glucose:(heptosyl)LPS alpha-1,3-glucosyltransferase